MNGTILPIVLPVFVVITMGFCLKKTGLVKREFMYDLNRLIYYIALPSLLFHKVATASFSSSFNPKLLAVMVIATVGCCLVSYIYASVRGYSPEVIGAFCQGSFRGNLAYIGLALIYQAYGESGLAIGGILLGFLVPLLNLLSILALVMAQKDHFEDLGFKFYLKQVLYNPLIIASLLGILWSFLGWSMPVIVDRSLAIITGMALPLALISIGASFSFKKLRGDLGVACLATMNKIVFMPIVTAVLLLIFGVDGQEFAIGVLFAATPVAAAAYIMAQQLHSDSELSGAIIALSTLCSLGTYTVTLFILQYYNLL